MKTPSERLDILEEKIEQLQREKLGAVTAAYAAVEAAMKRLRDEKLILGVNLRSIEAAMEQGQGAASSLPRPARRRSIRAVQRPLPLERLAIVLHG